MSEKGYVLAWLDGRTRMDGHAVMGVRRQIEDAIDPGDDKVPIDVWIESPGGDAHAAFALALLLRATASKVRVVVPDYAKSAATLLALAGDEIYLAPGAQLGPLDAQMPEEGSLAGQISALNIARAADDVSHNALDIALEGGAEVLRLTGLSRAKTMEVMLQFSARLSEPLLRQLDPRVVHDAKQMLNVTVRYAERLLSSTGCRNVERIARAMVENYPTHGFVIDIIEANRLGLPVRPIHEYEHLDLCREVHRAAEDGATLIDFASFDDATVEKEDSQDADGAKDEGGDTKDESDVEVAGGEAEGNGAGKARAEAV